MHCCTQPYQQRCNVECGSSVFRQSDEYVKHAFYALLPFLKRDHSEIRLSCFQIVNQLFNRSHVFRELVIANFREIMDLVLGVYFLLNRQCNE